MGYEIKMIVGKRGYGSPEHAKTTEKYEDGSGFKYQKDENHKFVPTGRTGYYFMAMAEIDLCKLGYQGDPLNRLITASFEIGKERSATEFVYFYGIDGNTEVTEDRYGAHIWPTPVAAVLEAMKESAEKQGPYRRLQWAIALLEAMKDDPEELEVIFYGH